MKPYYDSEAGQIYNGDSLEVLKTLPDKSVHCCVTSPPYWGLRDYGVRGQIGLEKTPDEYVSKMVEIFGEVKRVLRDDGTLWLNLGDSYFHNGAAFGDKKSTLEGSCHNYIRRGNKDKALRFKKSVYKPKDIVGIPWMMAFALRSDGWYLRQDIIWAKPNPMPESVKDRCTKAHEYIFLLSKSQKYYFDNESIREPAKDWGKRDRSNLRNGTSDPKLKHHGLSGKVTKTKIPHGWDTGKGTHGAYHRKGRGKSAYSFARETATEGKPGTSKQHRLERPDVDYCITRNKRSVWTITTQPFPAAHFATFPGTLIEPCILAGSPVGGTVLDPFFGAGTAGVVAHRLDRKFIGIELSDKYCNEIAIPRLEKETKQLKMF